MLLLFLGRIAAIASDSDLTATDEVAWSVCVSVYLLITFVSRAKTAEPIEIPSGSLTQVDPANHVLDRGPIPQGEGAIWVLTDL